jgi:hypothetical protein
MDFAKMMLLAAAFWLSGCTALETDESRAWLALHAVDTIQTYHAAQEPACYEEKDGLTRSLIGRHPSDGEVIAWSIGMAGVHLGVTEYLLRTDHPKLAKAWQYVRIGVTLDAVSNNYRAGIRIGSPNRLRNCVPAIPSPIDERPRPFK